MCKQDDNVYIDLSVVKQMIDDLLEINHRKMPFQCKCGSKKFTVDGKGFTCSICGAIDDRIQSGN